MDNIKLMKPGVKIVKNIVALISGQTYGLIMNLLSIGMIARYLPLQVFGDYGYVLAISMTYAIIIDMGTNQIMIREIVRRKDLTREIFSACFILKAFFSIIGFLLIVITIHLTSDSQQVLYSAYICALAIGFFMMGDLFEDSFKAYENMKYNAYLKIIEETSFIAGIFTVVYFDFGLYGVFSAQLLTYAIRVMVGYIMVSKKFFSPRIIWDMPTMKWIFKESYPIGISKIFRKVSLRIDTILLKLFRTREEVGLYHGVYRIIIVAQFIPRNITDSLFPLFSKYAADSNASMNAAFEKSFKYIFIVVLPLIFSVFLMSDKIVTMILGNKFASASSLLRLLVLVWIVTFFSIFCNKMLNAANRQKLASIATGICLIVNVILDLVLIPRIGYMGAGIATCAAEVVMFIVSFGFVYKYVCKVNILKIILKPLICGGIATVSGLLFTKGFSQYASVIGIITSCTVYMLMLIVLSVIEKEELNIMKEVVYSARNKLLKAASLKV